MRLCLFFLCVAAMAQPRFPQRQLAETEGAERALAERFLKETRTGLAGPWNIMLRSPAMSENLLNIYNYYRWKSTIPKPLMEIAILTVAREWSVQFEWFAHYPIALKEGVSGELLAELRVGKKPGKLKPEEELVYNFATELCRKHTVSDATFRRAKETFGEQNVVDLTGLIGTYISIGALLNMGQVEGAKTQGPDWLPPLR
ncbi:MAG: carboxymuconolactone decarboxylase family protein [Acidobacteria bacterium]|nr:carboxymuconolactone decarboxylase family protein [Acidobacteriota bacterium]